MLKTIYIGIAIIIILILLVILDNKTKIFGKIVNRFKDLFDVIKYRKIANTAINERNTINEKYIKVLETNTEALQKGIDDYKEKQQLNDKIDKLKAEIKELKRVIAEDMTPKRKKKGKKYENNRFIK